ncbi:HupE/UreJ family protein [Zhongshania sp.]|uniref:HupE/UreJ family protein n=1 Tax=Zhongshania sp. TaxID=1971902 RepID=UPI003569ECD7
MNKTIFTGRFYALIAAIAMLMFSNINVLAHGMSEADKQRAIEAGLPDYILLGAGHMLTGYDHLLFLFGVIFFLSRFADIVKFITAFTLGHSITLVFATLYSIQANYFLIDAVIALTVCYKGFENLDGFKRYLGVASPNLMWMVFGFGLIHGFGLSTRLQQLPMGDGSIVMKILAFNVGVELGQIAALAAMLVLLAGWRKTASFKRFNVMANTLLVIVGGLLFLHQLHGYQHTVLADNFPINIDDHSHIHEDMAAEAKANILDHYPRRIIAPQPSQYDEGAHEHGDGAYHSH